MDQKLMCKDEEGKTHFVTLNKKVSGTKLFIFFVAFWVIISMWLTIGNRMLNKFKFGEKGTITALTITIVITVIFAYVLSKSGLSLNTFEES